MIVASTIDIIAPVTLRRADDRYTLIFKDADGREAAVELEKVADESEAHWLVMLGWAEAEMQKSLMKRRRPTGRADKNGKGIHEGDILVTYYNESYPVAPAMVVWHPEKAAFVLHGKLAGPGPWYSANLEKVDQYEVVGNVFQTPELLTIGKMDPNGRTFLPAQRSSAA